MVYFIADNIISSLGFTSSENFDALKTGSTGIRMIDNPEIYPESFPGSIVHAEKLDELFSGLEIPGAFTYAEKMLFCSIDDALRQTEVDPSSTRTAFVVSTTKGNIDLLETSNKEKYEADRVLLWKMAEIIGRTFNNPNQPIVISNACVSGVLALNVAAGLIENKEYDHVIVSGVDIVSRFVVSGFMSFLSLSSEPCKPFDKDRDGLSLGEGAGTIILSREKLSEGNLVHMGGASANDANHISGPSRNGDGSYLAIKRTLNEAGLDSGQIDHISAHGTATLYNDEMESISISRHYMENVPVNSLKGFWGHTLGTAGIIETAALLHEMRTNTLIGSAGFQNIGVSRPIQVIPETCNQDVSVCLKMASGFGGSNAAMVIQKV